ncbi:Protein of unknown function [Sphingopyxis sp. YR583]|jgi:hypothetical protein|uniref:DUF2793 domain-containing protein n=1 Tax=Sphingopyxis sp. YR583 TaxID=1881047 RepID=UPI0008A74F88|nr:DUF2793 domain-containing protein [Sphingopyxis sp. YR583]SEH17433.1 Protein of unknown function [Sphingopyxis sp. YR583]
MTNPTTPRFSLPLLAAGQAQKEITHNEALTLLDALVHAAVEAGPVDAPPEDPTEGQCWIVGTAATGAWAGQGNRIAIHTGGGWRFAPPREGMRATRLADGAQLRFDGGTWLPPATMGAPSGGVIVDSEARGVISTLILHLAAQGLLISG